jgi:hypothetical protein
LAKELRDAYALAEALFIAAMLSHFERKNAAEVERLAADLIEMCTRHHFALYLAGGEILRGWARSTSGASAGGIAFIEDGIRDWRASGSRLRRTSYLKETLDGFLKIMHSLLNRFPLAGDIEFRTKSHVAAGFLGIQDCT